MSKFFHNEKVRLVFAYIIIPFTSFSNTKINLFETLKILYPNLQRLSEFEFFNTIPNGSLISFSILLLELTFLIPPTLIRFIFIRDGINYGLKMYFYTLLSGAISIVLAFLLEEGIIFPSITVLSVYIILSHKATGYNDMSVGVRYGLTFFTLIILLSYSSIVNDIIKNTLSSFSRNIVRNEIPINNSVVWVFLIFCYILNSHKQKKENSTQQKYESIIDKLPQKQSEENLNIKEEDNHKEELESKIVHLPDDNIADKLICVGLAHIGHKTKAVNRYLTTEIYMERTSIERLFWDLLSYKFKSDEHRKILKENFMFFKEICLFAIYKSILAKDNPDLYSRVTGNLKSKLSEDGYEKYDKNRREYFSIFSQKFGEAFNETKDINQSLRFSFWSTLASMYPDWITLEKIADILSNNYLFKIFQYSYDAINISYQAYKEKSI